VSKEELLMKDWFVSKGWTSQYHINTGVRRLPKLPPSCFELDFALVKKKLYVEIDGSVHNNESRKLRDARRTEILSGLGWRGLRVSANRIIESKRFNKRIQPDIEGVKREVMHFSRT
jgi:very-short-patch-repair endonuclease